MLQDATRLFRRGWSPLVLYLRSGWKQIHVGTTTVLVCFVCIKPLCSQHFFFALECVKEHLPAQALGNNSATAAFCLWSFLYIFRASACCWHRVLQIMASFATCVSSSTAAYGTAFHRLLLCHLQITLASSARRNHRKGAVISHYAQATVQYKRLSAPVNECYKVPKKTKRNKKKYIYISFIFYKKYIYICSPFSFSILAVFFCPWARWVNFMKQELGRVPIEECRGHLRLKLSYSIYYKQTAISAHPYF